MTQVGLTRMNQVRLSMGFFYQLKLMINSNKKVSLHSNNEISKLQLDIKMCMEDI